MMDNDHGHWSDEEGGSEEFEQHEHGAYWPPQPLARTRAFIAISDLAENANGASAAVECLRSIPGDLQDLDAFVELSRRALLGDHEALNSARRWLGDHSDPRLAGMLKHPEHDSRAADGELKAEPWVHPSALLDLTIGTAFTASDADRRGALNMVQRRVLAVVRSIAVTMTVLDDIPPQLTGRERFDVFLDRLGDFSRFDDLRLDLGGCLGELLDVLGRPNGTIDQAWKTGELEIDDNTSRIGSVAPDPVCTGARLTLTAKVGQSFIERSGVTVAFPPCGLLATDIMWTPNAVSVTVPGGAKSGNVYFAQPDTAARPALATTSAIEIGEVLGNCPYLGRGSATSIMTRALLDPLYSARCFLPLSVGIPLGVTEAPAIVLFRAVAQNGSPISNQSLPGPDDPITLEWEAAAEAGGNIDVRLLAGGASMATGLALRGKYAITRAQVTKTYTLEVTSNCGVVRRNLIVTVLHVLRFDPPNVSVVQGQIATLSLTVDLPFSADTVIFVTTSPSHPTAPGSVIMPAGQTRVPVSFPAMQPGQPHAAALTVIAYAPRHSAATGWVWVTPPLGLHRIIADRTGTQGMAAIDVVGVHAALTRTGSVLLFAYDESATGPAAINEGKAYAAINTGKSAVWEPGTSKVQSIPMSRNLFCSGHAFLGDGRLVVAGGQSSAITIEGALASILGGGVLPAADHDVHIFSGGAWSRVLPDMPGARWYPTCTTLPDGRVMIVSGYAAHLYATLNSHYEIVDPSTSSLVKRADFKALLPFNHEFDLYPFLQVLPGGNLFVHSHDTTWLLSLNSSNEPEIPSLGFTPYYNAKSPNSRTYPGQGACVLLPLDTDTPTRASVLIVGGGGGPHGGIDSTTPALNTAEIFEFDSRLALDAQSQWRFTRDNTGNQTFLTNRRLMADAVLLPDGTVAIIAGAGAGKADDAWPPIMWIEVFDPATETFTQQSGIYVPRLYHSTALLLPDGSVMMAGSTGSRWSQAIKGGSDNEFRIEIYYPPYLFRGPRPDLRLPTTSLKYGQQLAIEIPTGAKKIKRAALIRHGATTHTNNMDQRYVGMKIKSSTDTHITIGLPADGTLAPPGPYMLFVISDDANNDPVPSLGASVLLGP